MVREKIMRKKIVFIILSILISCIFFSTLLANGKAQAYNFNVNSEKVNVYIEKDGSITIEYWITFTNKGEPIYVVDIGFPNEHYNIDSVKADIDGHELTDIKPSTVIDIGVEIWLYPYEIASGNTKTLHVIGNNPEMIYEDYENNSLASVEFSPTWFDSDYASTFQYLEVNIYFPDGLSNGNIVKYHGEEFSGYSYDKDGDLIYTWIKTNVPMQQYTFGVSFPKSYVNTFQPSQTNPALVVIIITILLTISISSLAIGGIYLFYNYHKKFKRRYYPPSPKQSQRSVVVVICWLSIFAAIFFIPFWDAIGNVLLIILFFCVVIAGFGMMGYFLSKLLKKRYGKLPYDKPFIKIDSVGVNKHLTVVEAAIIQNIPLKKVVFLIMFSLIRTGHLKILSVEPLKFEAISPKGEEKIHPYQKDFLNAIISKGSRKGLVDQEKLKLLLINLIKATNKKMIGFHLEDTIHYYQSMIIEAWEEINGMPNEIKWEDIEDKLDWMILDDDFEDKSEKYFSNRYYYTTPYWYPYYYYYGYYWGPRHYYSYHPGNVSRTIPTERINMFTFADSIVRGMENMSNTIVQNFSNFANTIIQTVAPVQRPASGSRGGGSRSGGGCACACACAGCACACAGGGR